MIKKRHMYKGYIIDRDNLDRLYIYDRRSPYSEDSDKSYIADMVADCGKLRPITLKEVKAIIDASDTRRRVRLAHDDGAGFVFEDFWTGEVITSVDVGDLEDEIDWALVDQQAAELGLLVEQSDKEATK